MRHISCLHFLVLFLACQVASPVKAKLHSHSASCIPKQPHPSVWVCVHIVRVFIWGVCVAACALAFACVKVRGSSAAGVGLQQQTAGWGWCCSRLQLITAISTQQQQVGHDTQPQQCRCFRLGTIMALLHRSQGSHTGRPFELHCQTACVSFNICLTDSDYELSKLHKRANRALKRWTFSIQMTGHGVRCNFAASCDS